MGYLEFDSNSTISEFSLRPLNTSTKNKEHNKPFDDGFTNKTAFGLEKPVFSKYSFRNKVNIHFTNLEHFRLNFIDIFIGADKL